MGTLRGLRFFVSLSLLSAVLFLLARPWSVLPPLGAFLSTYHGIWQMAPHPFQSSDGEPLLLKGLRGQVKVVLDHDRIYHVFADNDEDLYFAQGFIVASDRLWQMEFISRLASGRVSEVAGPKALEMDKFFVKSGLPEVAKESAELMLRDELTGPILRAYTAGVNAYIQSLDPKLLPFEYRLLGYSPEEWTPYKTSLIGKFMAFYLSGLSSDLPLTRSRWLLHRIEFDDLFPLARNARETIVPKRTNWPFASPRLQEPIREFKPDLDSLATNLIQPDLGNGSNNWAVSAGKSTTGYPILSNDVHLGLHLPALWHQIQLSSPTHNTMGVSLVGVPGIMLGFNEHVAWGVTNGYNDILDWYQLRFRDAKQSEYLFQGEWRPVVSREAEIKIKGQAPLKVILRQTHFGPIVYDANEELSRPSVPRGVAMRWGALEPSNELRTFLLFNRSQSLRDCRKALEQFNAPDQNFLCADRFGGIGIWHMGRYPLKAPGQGRMILDGTSSIDEWKGWIPRDHVPHSVNPRQGYLLSANQGPTEASYPYYLGSEWMAPYRAMRIGELLRAKAKHSPEDIIAMQGDALSIPARKAVPHLLRAVKNQQESLDDLAKSALQVLAEWDFQYTETSVGATIYDVWYKHLKECLWSSRFPDPKEYAYPTLERTLELISEDAESKWFDDPNTEERETLREVAFGALKSALGELRANLGSKIDTWQWARHNPTHLRHMAQIPGLGRTVKARGSSQAIFANTGHHGPAWKVVVALGPRPQAWGVLPGGQAGDPRSRYYDTDLENWSQNQLRPLLFMSSADDKGVQTVTATRFELRGTQEEKEVGRAN